MVLRLAVCGLAFFALAPAPRGQTSAFGSAGCFAQPIAIVEAPSARAALRRPR